MHVHQVELMGREFKIRSEDDVEHVQSVAQYVNDQIENMTEGDRPVAMQNVLLLASLNLADELFKLRQEHEELRDTIRTRSRELIARIG